MEPTEILTTLRRRWPATLAVVLCAGAAALMTGYHVGVLPPSLSSRSVSSGSATAQVLVDSPASTLANLRQSTVPLTTRAGVFAQYMASSTIRDRVARRLGLPPAAVTTQGPFSGAGQVYDTPTPAAARELQLLDESKRYRLQFIAQTDLPLVTIYAQGPTPAAAARLADAVYPSVREELAAFPQPPGAAGRRQVVIRSLGRAQAGTVTSGGSKALMVLAFVAVLLLGLVAIVAESTARARRAARAHHTEAPGAIHFTRAAPTDALRFPSLSPETLTPEMAADGGDHRHGRVGSDLT